MTTPWGCEHPCACNCVEDLHRELAEAVEVIDQLLDDMGEDGLCVCQAAKDQARAFLQKRNNDVAIPVAST